jgi:hypothetical protein
VARYKVTFDMPLRLAVGERAMAIAGRLDLGQQPSSAQSVHMRLRTAGKTLRCVER